jgi:hypothetical protein
MEDLVEENTNIDVDLEVTILFSKGVHFVRKKDIQS